MIADIVESSRRWYLDFAKCSASPEKPVRPIAALKSPIKGMSDVAIVV
jgi:hypothetical protein